MDKKFFNEEFAKRSGGDEELSFEDLEKVSGGTITVPGTVIINGKTITAEEVYAQYEYLRKTEGEKAAQAYMRSFMEQYVEAAANGTLVIKEG